MPPDKVSNAPADRDTATDRATAPAGDHGVVDAGADMAEAPPRNVKEAVADPGVSPEVPVAREEEEPAARDEAGAAADPGKEHGLAHELFRYPHNWRVWPAVALLRWLLRYHRQGHRRRLIYRSLPTLSFQANEIHDIGFDKDSIDLTLTAPGIASPGSPLPTSDIERIVRDRTPPGRRALSTWLDGPTDIFMQIVEVAKVRYNSAFALATGGGDPAVRLISDLAGHSAPLRALPGQQLDRQFGPVPEGAVGLAAFFATPPSADGLAALLNAFSGVPTRVEEFTGGRVRSLRPAMIGAPMMRMLGTYCELPTAGADVIIEGGDNREARRWASDPKRVASLRLLCERYVGNPAIEIGLFLELNSVNIDSASLGEAMLGGMAVLGSKSEEETATEPQLVRLPLKA